MLGVCILIVTAKCTFPTTNTSNNFYKNQTFCGGFVWHFSALRFVFFVFVTCWCWPRLSWVRGIGSVQIAAYFISCTQGSMLGEGGWSRFWTGPEMIACFITGNGFWEEVYVGLESMEQEYSWLWARSFIGETAKAVIISSYPWKRPCLSM